MNKKAEFMGNMELNETTGRIAIIILGLLVIFPFLGIPSFMFNYSWGSTFSEHMWYLLAKTVLLSLMGLCLYIGFLGGRE
ncbi:hypothetical protein GF336_00225 [Candidatus Woesearchaeota archaeon]|nr:hypothetical protein [Candidatus Woesearchaeota archaeon]